jgi:hypothetical protein
MPTSAEIEAQLAVPLDGGPPVASRLEGSRA